jgi:polar amino acid transport system substrate-binding protein
MAQSHRPEPLDLINPGELTLGACPISGPPVHTIDEHGNHAGYEGNLATAIAGELGLRLRWEMADWADLYPALDSRRADAILYSQAIIPARRKLVDFTRPYGLFHESFLVLAGSDLQGPRDLSGERIGALGNTSNSRLAYAIDGAEVVEFPAGKEGFDGMLEALRSGDIAALVDDEIFLERFQERGFRVAFAVRTKNPYGIACRKGSGLLEPLNEVLADLHKGGRLEEMWHDAIPRHPFDPPEPQPDRSVEDLRAIVAAQFA